MARREFTPAQKAQIVARATDEHGSIRCERCRLALKLGGYEGYLEFRRGCFTDEGEPYGSAYVLTLAGWHALRSQP